MNLKRGFANWWLVMIFVIIIIVVFGIFFFRNNTDVMNNYFNNNIVEPAKDTIESQDSVEPIIDDSGLNDSVKSSIPNQDTPSASGGGSGSSTETTTTNNNTVKDNVTLPPEDVVTFSSLEELFNFDNPVNNRVSLHGMAISLAGVSTSEYFFFTDDSRVLNDINYILFNKPDYHVTVYNSIHVLIPQSIIDLTGTVVNCNQNDDGIYCVNADSIK
jgi:hypothetical protein